MNNQNQPGTMQETDTTNTTGDVVIPEYQEELVPEKVEQQEGMVHVHKDVVSEQQTVSAPVTHEQVEVERVPMHNQFDTPPSDAFQGEDIDIPLTGEQLVADKQVVETEEVRLHKQQVQEQEQVSGTVRREEVEVGQPGQMTTTGVAETMTTAQAAPVDTTTRAMQATPMQSVTDTTTPDQEVVQQGATYRIEAEPVDDTVVVRQTGNGVETTAPADGSQTTSGAQQGASNAKGKVDGLIDTVTDKIFGHNH